MVEDFLKSIRCFLLDLDGTLILDDKLLPGALELLTFLRTKELDYRLITNNSSKSKKVYLSKLGNLGLGIEPEELITSGEVMGDYLQKHYPGARLFIVGTQDLVNEITNFGFSTDAEDPDVLVLGFDTTLTYQKIDRFCHFLRLGKPYLATHSDINCPTTKGFIPDIGSMMAMISASTNRIPDAIMGKPFSPLVNFISRRTRFRPDQMCMVGDRMYTDMAMSEYGIHTILVLTGETKSDDLSLAVKKPEKVVENLLELVAHLNQQPIGK